MAVALLLITVGGIMVYSALHGTSIVDALGDVTGDVLDPHGAAPYTPAPNTSGATTSSDPLTGFPADPIGTLKGGTWKAPPGGAHSFKGPNANLLNQLAGIAQNTFHLTITATTNGGHVNNSYHFQGRAFDAAGSEANMRAFDSYVAKSYGKQVAELIHNPGPYNISNGREVNGAQVYAAVWNGHKGHVHLAA